MSADELEALRVWLSWHDYFLVHTDLTLWYRVERRRPASILLLLLRPLARHIYSGVKQRWIVLGKPRGWNTRLWMLYRPTGPRNVQDWYVDHLDLWGKNLFANLWGRLRQSDCMIKIKIGLHCILLSVLFLLFESHHDHTLVPQDSLMPRSDYQQTRGLGIRLRWGCT